MARPHLTDTGTHCGSLFDVPATGRPVNIPEFTYYRIDAERIAEVWGGAFGVHLLQQILEW